MRLPDGEPHLHILSPFDNLIIDRRWLKTFFDGFDYTIECYLPAAKRTYGYFVLPILWGDRFVARLDSKADRKPKTFIIKRLLFEPGFAASCVARVDGKTTRVCGVQWVRSFRRRRRAAWAHESHVDRCAQCLKPGDTKTAPVCLTRG